MLTSCTFALWLPEQVSRDTFIVFFSEVFDAMFRLCADSEQNVQNAVQFLDNLVKVSRNSSSSSDTATGRRITPAVRAQQMSSCSCELLHGADPAYAR